MRVWKLHASKRIKIYLLILPVLLPNTYKALNFFIAKLFFFFSFPSSNSFYASFVLVYLLQTNTLFIYVRPAVMPCQVVAQEMGNGWVASRMIQFKTGRVNSLKQPTNQLPNPLRCNFWQISFMGICWLSQVLLSQLSAVLLHRDICLAFQGRGMPIFFF